MHTISRKDLNSAELETARISKSPTTVITANAQVQTNEEATLYVKELDLFVTVKLFEDAPAVLSLGKVCEDHGCSYEWNSGHKQHLMKDGRRIQCNTGELRADRGPWFDDVVFPNQARLLHHLLHYQRRKLKVRYPIQHHPDVRVSVDWHGENRCFPTCQTGCKSSKTTSWMKEFLNT